MVVMLTTDTNIDRRIIQEADSLESVGWEVIIIAMPKAVKPLSGGDKRIVRLPFYPKIYKNNSKLLLLWVYRWINKCMPLSAKVRSLMRKVTWLALADIEEFYLSIFRDVVDQYKPSVFIAHDLPTLPAAFYAASKCNAKVVYDNHELYTEQEFSNLEKSKWKKLEQKYIKNCDSVITVNNLIAQELQTRYSLSDKVYVISNALPYRDVVNVQNKIFHQKFGLNDQDKVVLFQGGLSPNRNLEQLVQAMSCVRNPLLHLVILGNGPLERLLEDLTIKYNITNKVHFHPAVKQEELIKYTSCADIGIIPYQAVCLNNYYCTPNKLFEFIAAEIPILSSNLPAIEEVLNKFKIGLATDLGSAAQISKMLDWLFENEQVLKSYKKNVGKASKEVIWEDKKFTNIFEGYR
ncbi:MAG: glycosyltransferase [Rickettsiaceae bacterium]